MKMLTMLGVTFLFLLLSTFSMVGSAYYSDKNYKLGKFLWRTSTITGILYSISGIVALGICIKSFIDFLF